MGASQATGLGSAKAPEPHSRLRPPGAIPCAFTPGPWAANGNAIQTEAGEYVANLSTPRTVEEREANAHLIAAAPEMHRELIRLRMLSERFIEACPARTHKATQARNILYTAIDDADAVLAKARGEQVQS